jgi:hypothetical protein
MEPSQTLSTVPERGDTSNPDDLAPTEQQPAPDAQGPEGYEYICGNFAAVLTAFTRPIAPSTDANGDEDTNKCVVPRELLAPVN